MPELLDERTALADWIAEKLIRQRTVPVTTANVAVTGETVVLEISTAAGGRYQATFVDALEVSS